MVQRGPAPREGSARFGTEKSDLQVESTLSNGDFSVMSKTPALLIFWLGALASLGAQVAIVRAVFAGRGQGAAERTVRWREIAWVVTPALMLLAVLIATWMRINRAVPALPGPLG